MKLLTEYLSTKVKLSRIKATNETLTDIVREEIKRLGKDADLNHIDVSGVTNMCFSGPDEPDRLGGIFDNIDFCGDVSLWDVSNVEDMSLVFYKCYHFNGDLSNWNVHNIRKATSMFSECHEFEGIGLENWNVSELRDAHSMFNECKKFNPDITNWDTKNLIRSVQMFDGCKSLKRDLSKWDVSRVQQHVYMFSGIEYYEDFSKRPKFRT